MALFLMIMQLPHSKAGTYKIRKCKADFLVLRVYYEVYIIIMLITFVLYVVRWQLVSQHVVDNRHTCMYAVSI